MINLPLRFFSLFFISAAFLAITSCNKNDNNNNTSSGMYTVSGNASGSQMSPAISGSGTGTLTGTYNANTNVLTYNMAWANLSGAASSTAFYSGALGTNGTLVGNTTITTTGSTGASVGTITLTDAQETALLNGNLYYVVGTSAHASGEIRGQITAVAQ